MTVPRALAMKVEVLGGPRHRKPASTSESCLPPKSEMGDTKRIQRPFLTSWAEVPIWLQNDNYLIQSGYRPISESILKSIQSWAYLHNESVNIYSHLIGSILFFILPIYIFRSEIPPRYKIATKTDLVVCSIYFLGVAICFLLSATFHTIMNHSPKVNNIGVQLDFQGIILLMWSATVPLIYYGFYCDPPLQYVYWSLSTVLGAACSIFTFQPRFHDPYLRPLRAATFGSLSLACIIPVVHAIMKYGWPLQSQRMGLNWIFLTLTFNGLGAGAYSLKFPEKWCRRRFDIWGASHQWLHIMVICAGVTHMMGVLEAFDFLHGGEGQCVMIERVIGRVIGSWEPASSRAES